MRLIDADATLHRLKEWDTDDPMDKALYNFAVNRINEQPTIEERKTGWIPCSERLPEKYLGEWLCCTSDGEILVLPYDTPGDGSKECKFYRWDDNGYFYQTYDVIAWMPLPEPYKGDKE